MDNLPKLYDNAAVYCAEWRKSVGERNEALANVFEQMNEHNIKGIVI